MTPTGEHLPCGVEHIGLIAKSGDDPGLELEFAFRADIWFRMVWRPSLVTQGGR